MLNDIEKVLVSEEQIKARIAQLGEELSREYADKNPIVVGVLKGVVVFYADMIRAFPAPCQLDFMWISSYSGTGSTGDFSNANKLPYYSFMSQIKTVIVQEGVTAMGDRLFYGASNLTDVTIADTVTDIGEACFRQCASLKSVKICCF